MGSQHPGRKGYGAAAGAQGTGGFYSGCAGEIGFDVVTGIHGCEPDIEGRSGRLRAYDAYADSFHQEITQGSGCDIKVIAGPACQPAGGGGKDIIDSGFIQADVTESGYTGYCIDRVGAADDTAARIDVECQGDGSSIVNIQITECIMCFNGKGGRCCSCRSIDGLCAKD